MRSSITRLHVSMREARDFLTFAQAIEAFRANGGFSSRYVGDGGGMAVFVASPTWRRQAYAFAVVSIYGAHERFMRDLAESAAGSLARSYQEYDALPPEVRDAHIRLSLAYAKDIVDGKANPGADLKRVLTSLSACLSGSRDINTSVFSQSSSNFRTGVIRDVFSRIGFSLPQEHDDAALQQIIDANLNGLYGSVTAVIDDLGDRRNEVAHGSDYQIFDLGTMLSVLAAVYRYDCWVYRRVAQHILGRLVLDRGTLVAKVERTYTNKETKERTIASLPGVSAKVSVGSQVYVRGRDILLAVVRSIEKNGTPIDSAEPADSGWFGMDLGVKVYRNCELHMLAPQHAALAADLAAATQAEPLQWPRVEEATTVPSRNE